MGRGKQRNEGALAEGLAANKKWEHGVRHICLDAKNEVKGSRGEGEAFTLDRFLELSFPRHRKDNALQTFGSVPLSLPQIPSDAFGSIGC